VLVITRRYLIPSQKAKCCTYDIVFEASHEVLESGFIIWGWNLAHGLRVVAGDGRCGDVC
jgi:hypothetical protein